MSAATSELTRQQQAALNARAVSVSLAAGAGCGKTFVLTERFISHLDPTQVDAAAIEELVAITFTEAAAREMRQRIRQRCFQRLQSAGSTREAAGWQRLMRSIDGARISTIHSFCTQLLRAHAVEVGLDPRFEVLDAAAALLLKLEVCDDRRRALLIARDPDVMELSARRGLDQLRSDVARLAGPSADAAIERWLDATPLEVVAGWERFFEEVSLPMAVAELRATPEFQTLGELVAGERAGSDRLRAHLGKLRSQLHHSVGSGEAGAWGLALRELAKVQGVCTAKDWIDGEDYPRFRDACKAVRDMIDKSSLKRPLDVQACQEAARQGLALLRLVADVSESLAAAKSRRNQLEFDDLVSRTRKLLTDPRHADVRRQVAAGTRLVMVDEFQDTNPLQLEIISAVCGDDWRQQGLFAVGDFKQSIYRFNGAEPHVSTELREQLPAAGRLSLTTNFRSQPAITDFVNAVFYDAFEDYEPLVPFREQLTPTPAVEFLWAPCEEGCDDGDEVNGAGAAAALPARRAGAAREAKAREAQWIARRLRELLDSPDPIIPADAASDREGPSLRRLQSGDVAILLRTLSDAQVYEEALRDAGLEYYLAGGHAFYAQQEVYDILNLFRAVASTVDEIALAGALRSPLFSLSDETLFWMVNEFKTLNLALAARRPPKMAASDEQSKVARAAETLARLREEKDRLLLADLFHLALELTGFDAVLLTEFLGTRKAANVEKLIEQAHALDAVSPGDLPGFITQLSEFVVNAPKEPPAATQTEGDAIRIMTYHYAKGLEFPLVVLPDLDRQRRLSSTEAVLDEELGPLVPLDRESRGDGVTGLDLYRRRENFEELEERKRLLYVACTRAADYLILSANVADPANPKRDWLQLIDRKISLVDGSLRQLLPAGYGVPVVRVITESPTSVGQEGGAERGPDLERLVRKTRQLASERPLEIPDEVRAIAPHLAAQRRFSFSHVTGRLAPVALPAEETGESALMGEEVGGDAGKRLAKAIAGDSIDGREIGRLVHAVLERLDFNQPEQARELCSFIAAQYSPATAVVAAERAADMIERFLKSPRAAALVAAPLVRRELEFLLPWPADGSDYAGRYLQGYLDCLYQDANGLWRLLDYKTNRVTAATVSEIAAQYEMQMLVYSLACERVLGEPLAECTLCLLDLGVDKSFVWTESQRQAGVARITAAIDELITQG